MPGVVNKHLVITGLGGLAGSSSTGFTGDFETGDTTQYVSGTDLSGGASAPTIADSQSDPTHVRQGRYAAKFTLTSGQVRSELNSGLFLQEGEEWDFNFSTYLDAGWPTNQTDFEIITQWRQNDLNNSFVSYSPPVALSAGSSQAGGQNGVATGTDFCLVGGDTSDSRFAPWSISLGVVTTGAWIDWKVRLFFSTVANLSRCTVWRNGTQMYSGNLPGSSMYPSVRAGLPGAESVWKVGYYRGSSITTTGVVTHDAAVAQRVNRNGA